MSPRPSFGEAYGKRVSSLREETRLQPPLPRRGKILRATLERLTRGACAVSLPMKARWELRRYVKHTWGSGPPGRDHVHTIRDDVADRLAWADELRETALMGRRAVSDHANRPDVVR